eukprot:6750932-Prymnesium_polylepis.2
MRSSHSAASARESGSSRSHGPEWAWAAGPPPASPSPRLQGTCSCCCCYNTSERHSAIGLLTYLPIVVLTYLAEARPEPQRAAAAGSASRDGYWSRPHRGICLWAAAGLATTRVSKAVAAACCLPTFQTQAASRRRRQLSRSLPQRVGAAAARIRIRI